MTDIIRESTNGAAREPATADVGREAINHDAVDLLQCIFPDAPSEVIALGVRAVLEAIAAPLGGHAMAEGENARDAARWRALIGSDRIRMMGCAGFDTAQDGTVTLRDWDGWHHFGMEVWDKHPAKGDDSDSHGRKVLMAYVDALAITPPTTNDAISAGDKS